MYIQSILYKAKYKFLYRAYHKDICIKELKVPVRIYTSTTLFRKFISSFFIFISRLLFKNQEG